jgi:hypothetical protein
MPDAIFSDRRRRRKRSDCRLRRLPPHDLQQPADDRWKFIIGYGSAVKRRSFLHGARKMLWRLPVQAADESR